MAWSLAGRFGLLVGLVLVLIAAVLTPVDAIAQEEPPEVEPAEVEEVLAEPYREPGGELVVDEAETELPPPDWRNPELDLGRLEPERNLVVVPEDGGEIGVEGSAVTLRLGDGEVFEPGLAADIEVVDPEVAESVSPVGVLVGLDFPDEAGVSRPPESGFEIDIDLSDHGLLFGGSVASRLQAMRFDGCVEDREGEGLECESAVPLGSQWDPRARVMTVTVSDEEAWPVRPGVNPVRDELPVVDGTGTPVEPVEPDPTPDTTTTTTSVPDDAGATTTVAPTTTVPSTTAPESSTSTTVAPGSTTTTTSSDQLGRRRGLQPSGPVLLQGGGGGGSYTGIVAGTRGPAGDFSATPFPSESVHDVSLLTGSATSSYVIDVPTASAGPTPSLSFSYSSGSIDGMSSATNNQSGPVGLGWSLNLGGSIQRSLQGCGQFLTGSEDKCLWGDWGDLDEEQFTLTLNGRSSRLVQESGNSFVLEDDPHWLVTRKTSGAAHNYAGDEWWEVTTPDGIVYEFGQTVDSAQYVPVYYPSTPRPCGAGSWLCDTVYRWDLSRIEDLSGNEVEFEYQQEMNWYQAKANGATNVSDYVRAAHPRLVAYGSTTGGAQANGRVLLAWEERCGGGIYDDTCDWIAGNDAANYADTPGDQWCLEASTCGQAGDPIAPTFWTQSRLSSVQTQVYRSSGRWATVETHELSHMFPDPPDDPDGDVNEPKTALASFTRRPGGDYTHFGFAPIRAEDYDTKTGGTVTATNDVGGGNVVTSVDTGQSITFDDVYFGNSTGIGNAHQGWFRYSTIDPGMQVELWVADADGTNNTKLSTTSLPQTWFGVSFFSTVELLDFSNWEQGAGATTAIEGIRDLELKIVGTAGGEVDINWVRFEQVDMSEFDLTNPTHLNSLLYWLGFFPGLPGPSYWGTFFAETWRWLPNRVNAPAGVPDMQMPRIGTIIDTLGGVTVLNYGQSHPCATGVQYNFGNHQLDCFPAWDADSQNNPPNPGWVAWHKWKVTQRKVEPSANSGQADMIYNYTYTAPQWALDLGPAPCSSRAHNDFRGHNVVTVSNQGTGAKTETRFYTGMYDDLTICSGTNYKNITRTWGNGTGSLNDRYWLRGRAYEVRRLDGAIPLSRTRTTYHNRLTTAQTGWQAPRFVADSLVDDTNLVGADKTARTTYTYDDFGNTTRIDDIGDTSTTLDDRYHTTEYLDDGSGKHIVDRACLSETWDPQTGADVIVSRTRVAYDHGEFSSDPAADSCDDFGGLTRRGLPTHVWEYKGATNPMEPTVSVYNTRGQQTKVIDPEDNATLTSYHATHGDILTVTNDLGWVTTNSYDSRRRHIKTTDPNNNATNQTYDDYNRLTAVWMPTRASQHPSGDPSVRYSYSPLSRPATITTETLFDTSQSGNNQYLLEVQYFDGFGRTIQTQTRADDANARWVSAQHYDAAGRVDRSAPGFEKTGNPGDSYFALNWNTVQNHTRTTYDDLDRPLTQAQYEDATKKWQTTYVYDGWTTQTYDTDNGPTVKGIRTDHHYDAFDNLVEVENYLSNPTGTNPTPYSRTTYAYDHADRLTAVTDRGPNLASGSDDIVTTISYDLAGRKTQLNDPDAGTWQYFYDDNNNLVRQRDGDSNWTKLVYDDLNRITTRRESTSTNADGELIADYLWYASSPDRGHLHRTRAYEDGSAGGTIEATMLHEDFDADGRVTEQRWEIPHGGTTYKFRQDYAYGPAGQPTSINYPANTTNGTTAAVTTTYDWRSGLPTKLADHTGQLLAHSSEYGAWGQLTQRRFGSVGNRATETFIHDAPTARLGNYKVGFGGPPEPSDILSFAYAYNLDSNIKKIIDYRNTGTGTVGQRLCYEYDSLNRLTRGYTDGNNNECGGVSTRESGVGAAPYNESYAYDEYHNITQKTGAGPNYTYGAGNAGPHAVTSITGGTGGNYTFEYDNNGNQDRRNTPSVDHRLVYDHENQLEKVKINGTNDVQASFVYDADETRVKRTQKISGTNTTTLYISNTTEYTVGDGFTYHYHLDNDHIALRDTTNALHYIYNDHLTGTAATITSSGTSVAYQRYKPWGTIRTNGSQAQPTDIGYTGQRLDEQVSLLDYRSRHYDPLVARFAKPDRVVPDPTRTEDLNRYAYVRNNPINNIDPSGNEPCPKDGCTVDTHTYQTVLQYVQGTELAEIVLPQIVPAPTGKRPTWKGIASFVVFVASFAPVSGEAIDTVECARGFGFNGGTAFDCGAMVVPFASSRLDDAWSAMRQGSRSADVAPSATRHLCSFSGETQVLMADGTTKPISEVEIGEWVLAEDPETGERGARQVTHLWVHQDTIIDLEIDGYDVATTEDHPFWNHTESEWHPASALDAGDLVLTAEGATLTVDGMDWGSARTTTAYNLTVDDIHTYFVVVSGEEVLVHNVCEWTTRSRLRAAGPGDEFGLPSQGRIRYVPPENYNPANPLPRGPQNGYLDRFGNEWVVGPSRTPGQPFEWDVQLSRTGQNQIGWLSTDGSHVNVSPLGEVTH